MSFISIKQVYLLILSLVWSYQSIHGALGQYGSGGYSTSTDTTTTSMTTADPTTGTTPGALAQNQITTTTDPPLRVTVFSPLPDDVMGFNGAGWVVDLAIDATDPQFNSLISMSAGYVPFFNNPNNATTFKAGPDPGIPGLVVLLSTTPTVANSAIQGPTTNLAGFFQINTVALTNNGTTKQIWSTWQVGANAFGVNQACTLTVFVVNGTAPTQVTQASGLISNVATVNFTIAGTQTA